MSRSIQTKIEFPLNDLTDRRREDGRTEACLKLPTMLLNRKVTFECDVYRKLRLMSSSLIVVPHPKVRDIAQLVECQTLDTLPGSSPGSSRFGARYIRAS